MKILSSFTQPQVVSTLYMFISSVDHKTNGPHVRSLYFLVNTMDVSVDHQLFGYTFSSKYLLFNRKKINLTGLE